MAKLTKRKDNKKCSFLMNKSVICMSEKKDVSID